MTDDPYVCPQCGPDPRGSDAHADEFHTWPPVIHVRDALADAERAWITPEEAGARLMKLVDHYRHEDR